MNKEDMLLFLKGDRKHTERQVRDSIQMLRGILDRIESDLDEDNPQSLNGLQGNEWLLYTNLMKLEKESEFIKKLETME